MTEPLSSAEIEAAKKLRERADADPRSNEGRMYPGFASTVLPRALFTIEAKDAEIAAERKRIEEFGNPAGLRAALQDAHAELEAQRTARQEAERMLARAEAALYACDRISPETTAFALDGSEHEQTLKEAIARHRARQAKGEGGQR